MRGKGKVDGGKRRGEEGASLTYMDSDMVAGKGEPKGFWEYGIGRTFAYVMSLVLEVLVPTFTFLKSFGDSNNSQGWRWEFGAS